LCNYVNKVMLLGFIKQEARNKEGDYIMEIKDVKVTDFSEENRIKLSRLVNAKVPTSSAKSFKKQVREYIKNIKAVAV